MELTDIQEIMKQFENSDIRELNIDDGDFHLYLSKNRLNQNLPSAEKNADHAGKEVAVATEEKANQVDKTKEVIENTTPVKAPLVGVVYLQAKPGEAPFVKVGDHVEKGDTICIIEAMKIMTEVKSDISGTVTKVEVENKDLVEVDQPLISVKEG